MALKATIYKADLSVADMDRGYYADHALTLARHPSETDERLMVRLLAFALHANERLIFGKGISTDDEPDLWQKDYAGNIELWIDVGLPDPTWLRKACGQAERVVALLYGGRVADMWWAKHANDLARLDKLTVLVLPVEITLALGKMAARGMQLQCSIQDGQAWLNDGKESLAVEPQVLKAATERWA